MRITTNMVRRNYQDSLNSTLTGLNSARQQVDSGRRFSYSYEDPASASKGVVIENRYARNQEYISAVGDTIKWQDIQEGILTEINDIAKEIDNNYAMAAVNGTNENNRQEYATTFRAMQESMVYAMNAMYGETYVANGNETQEAPFELLDDGTVTFRGLDVSDPANQAQLEEFAKETSYVDLGFGLQFDAAGEIVPSTAFDMSMPGINVVGFGVDADGNPVNMIELVGEMAEVLEAPTFDSARYHELWEAFGDGADSVRNQLAEIGTKSKLLETTESRLELESVNIDEQYKDAVGIEASEAIMNFSYADYVYNASLKVGMNILTPSLLDFLQ